MTPDGGSAPDASDASADADGRTEPMSAANANSLAFDGVDDVVELATVLDPSAPVNVTLTTPMTVEMWVKLDPAGSFPQMLFESSFPAGLNTSVFLAIEVTPRVRCRAVGTVINDFSGTTNVADGAWHHVACSSDGHVARIVVDGKVEATLPNLMAVLPGGVAVLMLGRSATTGLSGRFEGAIDELRIWTVARTAADIDGLRWTSIAGSAPSLAANWTFAEGSGQLVHDTTGHLPPAPLGSNTTVEPDDPSWVTDVPFP